MYIALKLLSCSSSLDLRVFSGSGARTSRRRLDGGAGSEATTQLQRSLDLTLGPEHLMFNTEMLVGTWHC